MGKTVVAGVMSGTSLDGLDIAICEFEKSDHWSYKILDAITIKYPDHLLDQLRQATLLSDHELASLDLDLGTFIGAQIAQFSDKSNQNPDLIASHGHTVFHEPEKGITVQIGSGKIIAELTETPTVSDFRSLDVSLGGQGAPLVPIGDRLLFGSYGHCLNLGGISNVSYEENGQRLAYDICFVNMALNKLANELGHEYDQQGELACSGSMDNELLQRLNALTYFSANGPKSLGKEDFEEWMWPILIHSGVSVTDRLHTFCEHIAIQIGNNIKSGSTTLVTGGGAHNDYLVDRIKAHTNSSIIIPKPNLIDFKEALIFGFLGVLRIRNEINCLSSVTGATRDSSGGVVFLP